MKTEQTELRETTPRDVVNFIDLRKAQVQSEFDVLNRQIQIMELQLQALYATRTGFDRCLSELAMVSVKVQTIDALNPLKT